MKKPVDDSIGFFFLGQLAKEISEYLLGYSVGCRSPKSSAQLGMGLTLCIQQPLNSDAYATFL